MNFYPIGIAHTPFKARFGTPRQPGLASEARATIEIFRHGDLNGCLVGLENFSHVWLLFGFHENTNSQVRGKVHPPRLDGRTVGLFATRTPHRPNPIGLSVVKILKVHEWSVEVSGVDLIDETPVFDIKPYLPKIESIPDARAGWTESLQESHLEVEISESANLKIQELVPSTEQESMRNLLVQTLRLDPRPVVYRKSPVGKYRQNHAAYIGPLDVRFNFTNNKVTVTDVSLKAGDEL